MTTPADLYSRKFSDVEEAYLDEAAKFYGKAVEDDQTWDIQGEFSKLQAHGLGLGLDSAQMADLGDYAEAWVEEGLDDPDQRLDLRQIFIAELNRHLSDDEIGQYYDKLVLTDFQRNMAELHMKRCFLCRHAYEELKYLVEGVDEL